MSILGGFVDTMHPMTVHFQRALIIVSCCLGVIFVIKNKDPFLNSCIRVLVILSALGAWGAVITGSYHLTLTEQAELIKHIHHNFATATSWVISASAVLYILFSFYKKKFPNWLEIGRASCRERVYVLV